MKSYFSWVTRFLRLLCVAVISAAVHHPPLTASPAERTANTSCVGTPRLRPGFGCHWKLNPLVLSVSGNAAKDVASVTFVLQGGKGIWFNDFLFQFCGGSEVSCRAVIADFPLLQNYPEMQISLSVRIQSSKPQPGVTPSPPARSLDLCCIFFSK